MKVLKKIKFILFSGFYLVTACSTSSYKVIRQSAYMTEFSASADRVLVKCEFIDNFSGEAKDKDPHAFVMHVLDEEKTVLTLIIEPVLSKNECEMHLSETAKILKGGGEMHIIGQYNLESPREISKEKYSFSNLGTYPSNSRVLRYRTIWNDHGQCYNVNSGKQKPCPRNEFPE